MSRGSSEEVRPLRAVHESRRAALALRGAHAIASIALLAACSLAVLASEGGGRRAAWDACADILLAHGLVAVLLVPVLLLATARLRRGAPLAARRLVVRPGAVRLLLEGDEVLDLAPGEAAVERVTPTGSGATRLTLSLGAGLVRDRLHLDLPAAEAASLLARLRGPRPIDAGVRTLETSGWTLTSSYAAAWIAALVATPRLRDVVPLAPGEPGAATDHAGWLLGIGVAAFWIAHAALAFWTAPRARLVVGADGVQVIRLRTRAFVSFAELVCVERRRRALRLHRADGAPIDVPLGMVGARAVEGVAAAVRAADEAADAARVAGRPPASAAEVRAHAARLVAEGYRVEPLGDDRLAAVIEAPRSGPGARIGAAIALAARGAEGRRAVRCHAATIVDEETRQVLEAIAAGEVDDGLIERALAPRAATL